MGLESRLAWMVGRAGKLQPELSGHLPCGISLAGLSETEKCFLALCADIVEKQDCSKGNALRLVKFAKVILAKRTDNGKLVAESIGWVFKRNCYSVAMGCLNAVEAASARSDDVGVSVLKEVRMLAEKVGDPALAGFLKECLGPVSDKGKGAEILPSLLLGHAVSKNPVLSVWGGLKRSPGVQLVLNVLVTWVLVAIIVWLNVPSPALNTVLLASIVHMAYLWRVVIPEFRQEREYEKNRKDPLLWYSRIEETLRKKPEVSGKELAAMLENFMYALSQMPAKDREDRKKMARNFRMALMPKARMRIGKGEFARLDRTLEDLSNRSSLK